MDSKQLYEKQSNQFNPFFPIVRLEDIIDKISDKSIQWILNNYNHIYVEYSESREVTRNKVPQMLRRSGLWISYNNGKKNITEYYIGENTDVNNYVEWTLDDNWKEFDELTIQDKSITYQHLSDALRQLLAGDNTITNFPDEEDITSSGGVLSFKDRDYEPNNFSGLGRVILRKNITVDKDSNVKNILTQGMIDKENIIYEIRYDFDLNGAEITIPEGCVLDFQGGSLNNGKLKGKAKVTRTSRVFGKDLHLFYPIIDNGLELIKPFEVTIQEDNKFFSLTSFRLFKRGETANILDIIRLSEKGSDITEYINENNAFVHNTKTIAIVNKNTGKSVERYESGHEYSVYNLEPIKFDCFVIEGEISEDMYNIDSDENRLLSAINYAQISNIPLYVRNSYTINEPIIITRHCSLDFNSRVIKANGDGINIFSIVNNETVKLSNVTIECTDDLTHNAVNVYSMSRSELYNIFGLNCNKCINMNAYANIIYSRIEKIKSYNANYCIYSENKFPENIIYSFNNGNKIHVSNTSTCHIDGIYLNKALGVDLHCSDGEVLGSLHSIYLDNTRANIIGCFWIETGASIAIVNHSVLTIVGDTWNHGGVYYDDTSLVSYGSSNYSGYYWTQIDDKENFNLNLERLIEFHPFNNRSVSFDSIKSEILESKVYDNKNGSVSTQGYVKLGVNSIFDKTIIINLQHTGNFADYNLQDRLYICRGTNLVTPSSTNDSINIVRFTWNDLRRYEYFMPILAVIKTDSNISNVSVAQKGNVEFTFMLTLKNDGVYYKAGKREYKVCNLEDFNNSSGDYYLYFQTNKSNFALKRITISNNIYNDTTEYAAEASKIRNIKTKSPVILTDIDLSKQTEGNAALLGIDLNTNNVKYHLKGKSYKILPADGVIVNNANEIVKENTKYIINKAIDLQNSTLSIPNNSVLEFTYNGKFVNGKLDLNNAEVLPAGININNLCGGNVERVRNGQIVYSSFYGGTGYYYNDDFVFPNRIISGNFENKPFFESDNNYIGFSFFCTNRKTTEGVNGIMIYHRGSNVWVDALGRVVE